MRSSLLRVLSLFIVATFAAAMFTACDSSSKSPTPPTTGGTGGGGTGGGGTGGGGTGGGGGGTGSNASTVAFVYVGSANFTGSGTITGFNVTNDAVAHALPGSPYSGPAGSVVTTSADVFATDGTNIQSYLRNADGSLVRGPSISGVAHNDTPVGSGVGPLTLDHTGHNLYAGEINFQGADNAAIATFTIGNGGVLTFLANTSINVDAASQLTFTQDNRFAYGQGCFFINFDLFGVARLPSGALQFIGDNAAIPSTGNINDTVCPEASSASALNFLALEAGIIGNGTTTDFLVTYRINSDGTLSLTPNPNVPLTVPGRAMAFDPTGNFLAVGEQGGLQVFQLSPTGMLTPVGSPQQTSVSFDAVRWDNSGHLYAIGNSALYIFNSNQSVVTQAAGSPYPVTSEGSLAVLPTK